MPKDINTVILTSAELSLVVRVTSMSLMYDWVDGPIPRLHNDVYKNI